jgi:S-adenosylmethionine hydrolase
VSTRRVITLTTDFGLRDPYVAQMKAVLLSMAPDAEIVDVTHEVEPQDVIEGAFVLETTWRYFPAGSVHVAVVDPGVGTSRRRLILQKEGHTFVGPDNGLLSCALPDSRRQQRRDGDSYEAGMVTDITAFCIDRLDLLPRPPSATFEGRDVFAPIAALLAARAEPADFGPATQEAFAVQRFRAPVDGAALRGVCVRVDRFGNLITDIRGEDVAPESAVSLGRRRLPLARTYGEADGLCAVIGSTGYVEVALANGNAAADLGAGKGSAVVCEARR